MYKECLITFPVRRPDLPISLSPSYNCLCHFKSATEVPGIPGMANAPGASYLIPDINIPIAPPITNPTITYGPLGEGNLLHRPWQFWINYIRFGDLMSTMIVEISELREIALLLVYFLILDVERLTFLTDFVQMDLERLTSLGFWAQKLFDWNFPQIPIAWNNTTSGTRYCGLISWKLNFNQVFSIVPVTFIKHWVPERLLASFQAWHYLRMNLTTKICIEGNLFLLL